MAQEIPSQSPEHLTDRHAQGPSNIEDTHASEHHVVPLSTYFTVFGILMLLLVLTVGAALYDFSEHGLPWLNVVVAMTIALIKACLILWYFMHLKFATTVTKLFACAAFMWLVIMFALGNADYFTRAWLPTPGR